MNDGPTCNRCGAQVIWVRRGPNQPWHPPLVRMGYVTTLGADGYPVEVEALVRHTCDPTDVAAFEAHQARLAQARQAEADRAEEKANERRLVLAEQAAWRKERASIRDQAWRLAKQVGCPRCEVKKNKRCENLIVRGKGGKQHTAWPHPERVLLAEKEGKT